MADANLSRLPEPTNLFTPEERTYLHQLLRVLRLNMDDLSRNLGTDTEPTDGSNFWCELDGGTPEEDFCGGVDLGTPEDEISSFIYWNAEGP